MKLVELDEKHELCLCTEPVILGMFHTAIMRGSTTHFMRAVYLLAKIAAMRRDVGRKIMEKVGEITGNKGDKYLPVVTARSVVLYLKDRLEKLSSQVEIEISDLRTSGKVKLKSLKIQNTKKTYESLCNILLKELFNCQKFNHKKNIRNNIDNICDEPYNYLQPPTCPICRGKINIRVVYLLDDRNVLVRCLKCGSYYVAGRYTLIKYSERGSKVENLNLVTGRAT